METQSDTEPTGGGCNVRSSDLLGGSLADCFHARAAAREVFQKSHGVRPTTENMRAGGCTLVMNSLTYVGIMLPEKAMDRIDVLRATHTGDDGTKYIADLPVEFDESAEGISVRVPPNA